MNISYVLFLTPLLTVLGIVLPLGAQVVNDGATNTLSNVTNTFTGDVTVGTNGSFSLLILSDNALLTNSVNGVIGLNATARSNEVRLASPTGRWLVGGDLSVGQNGAFNRLVVSNGGLVSDFTGTVGYESVGGPVANSNVAVVTGIGSLWTNANNLFVGYFGAGNQLVVSNGGTVADRFGVLSASGGRDVAVVTGAGSAWRNSRDLWVGESGHSNRLTVSNGGLVVNDSGVLGLSISSGNETLVTGAGSLWSNRLDLTVGGFGSGGNRLVVSNGATVAASNVFVGVFDTSLANRVTVDGGTLRVTNVAGTGVLDVRRGTNILNAGLIEADRVLVTNSLGRFELNGGTLRVGTFTIGNGLSFGVGDGVSPATLNLTGDGTHSFSSLLTIRSNATLMGNGTILMTMSVQFGSTLSPGAAPGAIGRLASSGSVPLGSTSIMEISKSGSVLTNDQFQVANILTYLGAIIVSNLGPDALTAGDRFQLFPAGSYGSSFATISLPPLAFGLVWATNLLVDGSIEVLDSRPSVTTLPASGLSQTNATLNGMANPKGTETSARFEYGFTTNYGFVTPPQALGGGNGNTNFSEAISGLIPGVPYHFRAVASNAFGVAFGADQSFHRLAQRDYIKASNTGVNDEFGDTVAMDGDTLVVGAPFEASNASGVNGDQNNNSLTTAGAAYVFVRSGDSLVQQAYLKASNPGAIDDFGTSVAISGDTIVIGAPFEDSNATGVNGDQSNNSVGGAGAAYVFVRTGTNWSQQAYLKAADTNGVCSTLSCSGCSCFPGDFFGTSVAVSGDTIVVGAPFDDSNATGVNGSAADNSARDSGAAYIFVRNGTNWTQQAYLKASNTGGAANTNVLGDLFGTSVAVSGDTVVISAPREDSNATGVNGDESNNSATDSGAAYVFVRSGTVWSQQAYLKASNTGSGDSFGVSVSLSSDTLVVGATGEDSNATGVNGDQNGCCAGGSGAAYVFARNGTTWSQQAYLKASNTGASDDFGLSVAVSGDTVIVGAEQEDSNAIGVNGDGGNNSQTNSGAAYLFVRNGTSWSFQDYLKASNTEGGAPPFIGDRFGTAVAVAGDFVVVGAPFESSNAIGLNGDQNNNGAQYSGAAYLFGPPRPPAPEISLSQSNTNIPNGGVSQQYVVAGTNAQSLGFSIKNTGNAELTGLTITIDGPDAAAFTVVTGPVAPLAPTSNTIFTVRFAATRTGTKTATLHIASNDADENPFNIQLSGVSLSFTEDRDGDGLNDASELLMASLGFNFQVNQTSLVNTLFNNANGAGLFTPSQLQALNVDTPLLARDPFTGLFTLTIGVEKATQLTNFFPFPMTAPQTTINAEGKLEFQFSSPDGAAFFRLEAR